MRTSRVRQRFFAKRRKFADLAELNGWLADQCRDPALTHKHPDLPHLTVAEVFKEEPLPPAEGDLRL